MSNEQQTSKERADRLDANVSLFALDKYASDTRPADIEFREVHELCKEIERLTRVNASLQSIVTLRERAEAVAWAKVREIVRLRAADEPTSVQSQEPSAYLRIYPNGRLGHQYELTREPPQYVGANDVVTPLYARSPGAAEPPKDPREERLREAFLKCRQMLATQTGTFYNAAHFGLTPEDIGMERASVTKNSVETAPEGRGVRDNPPPHALGSSEGADTHSRLSEPDAANVAKPHDDPTAHRVADLRAQSQPTDEPSAGVKCTHCNGKGYNEPIYDEQDGWIDETPCETCNGSGRITTVEQYLKTLPANWHEDSSLETWFPITAEELKRLKDARATVPPTTSPFEFCVFIGDPPSGYASWSDWAAEPTKRYVTIRASETKDAGECGACDKPGEHCANVHGICSRHGGRAHETKGGQS